MEPPGQGHARAEGGEEEERSGAPPNWEDCSALQSAYTRAMRGTLGKTLGSPRSSLLVSAGILEQQDALLMGDADRLGP